MNIAVIGGGISGLVCAHVLGREHQITLFESESWLGGHTHTVEVDGLAVDTGFIVFNDRTYPNFEKFLDQLGVEKRPTQMSFSVSDSQQNLEYNGHTFASLFAQRRNIFRPKFWGMIRQILRFNKLATELAQQQQIGDISLGEFLQQNGFDGWLESHYLLPMGAAIWSASIDDMRQFPLRFFIRFFHHHGLLSVTNRPQWYTVKGGSWQYVKALQRNPNFALEQGNAITAVKRTDDGVELTDSSGKSWQFDEVIFACHSDQALKLLSDATEAEQQVLGQIEYRDNEVILHSDVGQLPKRRAAWASWNYLMGAGERAPVTVTYNMNILQGLNSDKTYCVTLNPVTPIAADKVLQRFNYAHPQFTLAAEQAKAQRQRICGHNHSHFCGAYWYNGFHEDGVRSALDVCRRFGAEL
ncbi:NAD(P)/FAD-dependent oxidoreductase [Ferrimonas senticii]|uniref:NAD(P)/FAD-dependent oxidoreductase n=1 Tax=Ferrimonas senticii TaxID=394566 RepID=UPI0004277B04|nr:FAD-dependent oxidoreductase [Ferrimonas senticii]